MTPLERAVVAGTQAGLPLVPKPYEAVARAIGATESEVRATLAAMLADRRVRRIGLVPNHYTLGYRHNGMTVWDVPDEAIEEAGRRVAALPFVSHCYRRPRHLPDWPYNLFAMVHGRTREDGDGLVAQIREVLGADCRAHEVLYSTRILKKTGLRIA